MNRSDFLRLCAIFGAGLPFYSTIISCKKNDEIEPNGKSVIIVGAGISGLAAAKKLREEGFEVTVIEAQSKIGGRTRTDRSLGFAFDEGATWIHGVNRNPLMDLAEEAGMTSGFADDTSIKSYDLGGTLRSQSTYTDAEDELYQILKKMMNDGSDGTSFETVFKSLYPNKANDRLWKFLLSAFVTFDTGDLDKLSSLLYYEGEEYGGGERIVTNGYDTIAEYLATNVTVLLNERVSDINYSSSKVKVTRSGGESEADYALVTVPLGVLKAGSIKFSPNLNSTKQNAINKLGMSCVNKFILTWDSVFWDDVQYISYTPETPDKFNYFVNLDKVNPASKALITFAYAEYARHTETLSDEEVIAEIMVHLRDIYGDNIPEPNNFLRTKWQGNENAFGSYSYTSVETKMSYFDDLAAEVNNKLFFAGEHTEKEYFSTVHGAYLSGIREADKIIDLL